MNEVQNISELSAKITRLTQDNLTLVQENRTLTDENIRLKHELLYYKRLFYGRRSEKRMPETPQGELFLCFEGEERLPEETDEIIPIKKEIEIEAHKRRLRKKENREKAKRQPIPADIERRTRVIEPAGVDMEQLEKIGEDVREIPHYIPGDFYVDRIYVRSISLKIRTIPMFQPLFSRLPPLKPLSPTATLVRICWLKSSLVSTSITCPFIVNWRFSNAGASNLHDLPSIPGHTRLQMDYTLYMRKL